MAKSTTRPAAARHQRGSVASGQRDDGVASEIVLDDSALRLLSDEAFTTAWDALHTACPWASAFQRRDFVATWYASYAARYRPVLVVGHGSDGALRAVLPLAAPIGGGDLVAAGSHHAEYQGWLSSADDGDAFMGAALELLRHRFRGAALTFLYLAPGAPTGWTAGPRTVTRAVSRALLDVADEERGAASLRKRSNRSRLNRLRRAGEVVFERITGAAEFRAALDEIIPLYDLRQGAVNGVLPFADDPLKRAFHEALFELPGLLHVTVLRVAGEVGAAHIGVVDGDSLGLGVFAHAAAHARHSPGKLLLLHLAGRLAEEGLATLDLTPGTGWKDRFASRHDEALVVRVFFSTRRAAAHRARLATETAARSVVTALGSSPAAVRELVSRVRAVGPIDAVCRRGRRARLYAMPAPTARRLFPAAGAADFDVGRTDHLLLDRAHLGHSLALLERPSTPYTSTAEGRLAASGFTTDRTRGWFVPEVGGEVALPEGSVGVHVLCRSAALRPLLERLLAEAARIDGARTVWLPVAEADAELEALAAELGLAPRLRVAAAGCGTTGRTPTVERVRRSGAPELAMGVGAGKASMAIKILLLGAARAVGLFALARRLTASDLRILCYHGFALHDESAFGPRLFMESKTFAQRMDRLRALGYPVLRLEEALRRLEDGTLPPAATVITIDDGPSSILSRGLEHLVRNRFPATLYQTTYYTVNQSPVFRVAVQYALWSTPLTSLELDGLAPGSSGSVSLADARAVDVEIWRIIAHAESELDEPGRCRLAREIFVRLGVDWDELRESRLLGLLDRDELAQLVASGVDLQLHTHRHRLPVDESQVRREIEDNRAVLEPIAGRRLEHLCYPSSRYDRRHLPWLRDLGIKSGTTCNAGLNPPGTDPFELNRIVDGECVTAIGFEAEMSGFLELVRRLRQRLRPAGSLSE